MDQTELQSPEVNTRKINLGTNDAARNYFELMTETETPETNPKLIRNYAKIPKLCQNSETIPKLRNYAETKFICRV